MQLILIQCTHFFANGNDMFNPALNSDWKRYYPAMDQDSTQWALRSLVIKEGNKVLLIDSGFSRLYQKDLDEYHVKALKPIENILSDLNIDHRNITHMLYTHLHLDHCGGGFIRNGEGIVVSLFPQAQVIVSAEQMNSALKPSQFEQASFQPEIVGAIAKSRIMDTIENNLYFFPWLELYLCNGHTKGLIIPIIHLGKISVAFVGDLIPSVAHLLTNNTMIYDVNPLLTIAEREEFLEEAYENRYILLFQHDYYNECCSLIKENERIIPEKCFTLEEALK